MKKPSNMSTIPAPSLIAEYVRKCDEMDAADAVATYRDSLFYKPLQCTMLTTPCGCRIVGEGNLPSPLRIRFCEAHARVEA